MNQKPIKICSKCGSTNITFDSTTMSNGAVNNICLDCRYGKLQFNSFFPEILEEEVEEFRKNLLK